MIRRKTTSPGCLAAAWTRARRFVTWLSHPVSTADCFFTSNQAAATLTTDYTLLPGVLHAYAASAQDLAGYLRPVPEPSSMLLLGLSLAAMGVQRARLRAKGQAAAS